MTVIAQRGRTSFLIDVGEGQARVLDIEHEPTLFARASADAILSHGYWQPFHGDEQPILELASHVEQEGEEIPSAGWDAEPRCVLRGVRLAPEEIGIEQVLIVSSVGAVRRAGAPSGRSRAMLAEELPSSIWTQETALAR